MNKFDLTIIVTVFNLEEYIEQCLKSITKQADSAVEVIIVNDGSRDGSGGVCDNFANGKNIIVIHQENLGVSSARNIGIKRARGDYITFIDGDDILVDGAIFEIRKKIRQLSPDIIAGRFQKFYNTIAKAKLDTIDKSIIEFIETKSGLEAFREFLRSSIFLPSMCTTICSKKLLLDYNVSFNTSLINNEDLDCAINLYMTAKTFAVLERPHYLYRQSRRTSATKQYTSKRIKSSLLFLATWYDRISQLSDDNVIKPWLMDYLLYQYFIMLGSIYMCDKRERKQLLREAQDLRQLFLYAQKGPTRKLAMVCQLLGSSLTARLLSWTIRYKSFVGKYA